MCRIDEELLREVRDKSEYIRSQLEGAPGIKQVTGLGLMLGVETVKDASLVISDCLEKGVLILKAKEKLRLLPPLNISMDELDQAIMTIKEVCAQ